MPRGEARLRLQFSAAHSDAAIESVIDVLAKSGAAPTFPVTTSSHCPGPLAVEHRLASSKTNGSGPIGDSFSPSSVDSLSGVRRPSRSESLGSDQQRLRPARLRRSCRQGQGRSTGQTSGADVRTVHRAAEAALRHGAAARALPNPRGRFPILVPRSSIRLGADGASFLRRLAPGVGSTSVRLPRRTSPRPIRRRPAFHRSSASS